MKSAAYFEAAGVAFVVVDGIVRALADAYEAGGRAAALGPHGVAVFVFLPQLAALCGSGGSGAGGF